MLLMRRPNFRLLVLTLFLQEAFEERGIIEVIFDGVLALASDNDDVFDAGGDAFFNDVLNLRLVHKRPHFLGLRLVAGKKRVPRPAAGIRLCELRVGGDFLRRLLRVCRHVVRNRFSFSIICGFVSTVDAGREFCQSSTAYTAVWKTVLGRFAGFSLGKRGSEGARKMSARRHLK